MANNLNLEALKSHLFETLEGIKNQNDKTASACEKVSIEQAKAIVDVADTIIDIYKIQVDALKVVSTMDNIAKPGDILVGMGLTGSEEVAMIS
jgi:hypothetical protein